MKLLILLISTSLLTACAANFPVYVVPSNTEKTSVVNVALEGDGFASINICDGSASWKLLGEVGDGASLHDIFFINYRVPARSFKQTLPAGKRIKIGGNYYWNSGDPGAGYRVVATRSCKVAVSLVPDADYSYDAVWKMDDKSCHLIVYRLIPVDGILQRFIDPTLQLSDVSCN